MKRLAEARDELARPRREEALANRLAAELEVVRGELASARQAAGAYAVLQREESEIALELRAMRVRLRELRSAIGSCSCWRLAGSTTTVPARQPASWPRSRRSGLQ